MHFIKLTQEGGSPTFVNMKLVCELVPLRHAVGTLVLFQCTSHDGEQSSTKVQETAEEILAKC